MNPQLLWVHVQGLFKLKVDKTTVLGVGESGHEVPPLDKNLLVIEERD